MDDRTCKYLVSRRLGGAWAHGYRCDEPAVVPGVCARHLDEVTGLVRRER